MKWWIIVFGVLSNAAASSTLKYAMTHPPKGSSLILSYFSHLPLYVGLSLYGIAFALYALALKTMPLNIAYPVLTAGALAVVALISIFFFKEAFTWKTAVGFGLIIAGVFFINQK